MKERLSTGLFRLLRLQEITVPVDNAEKLTYLSINIEIAYYFVIMPTAASRQRYTFHTDLDFRI